MGNNQCTTKPRKQPIKPQFPETIIITGESFQEYDSSKQFMEYHTTQLSKNQIEIKYSEDFQGFVLFSLRNISNKKILLDDIAPIYHTKMSSEQHAFLKSILIGKTTYFFLGIGGGHKIFVQNYFMYYKEEKLQNLLQFKQKISLLLAQLQIQNENIYKRLTKFCEDFKKENFETNLKNNLSALRTFEKQEGARGYSAIYKCSQLIDLQTNFGFQILKGKHDDNFLNYSVITIYGLSDKGKTLFLKKIFGQENIQDGFHIKTEGLSILQHEFNGRQFVIIDIEGSNSSYDKSSQKIRNIVSTQIPDQLKPWHYQRTCEYSISQFASNRSDILFMIVNSLSDLEQLEILDLINSVKFQSEKNDAINGKGKHLIIIHNLMSKKKRDSLEDEIKTICKMFSITPQKCQQFGYIGELIDDEDKKIPDVYIQHIEENSQKNFVQHFFLGSYDIGSENISYNMKIVKQIQEIVRTAKVSTKDKQLEELIIEDFQQFYHKNLKFISEKSGERDFIQEKMDMKPEHKGGEFWVKYQHPVEFIIDHNSLSGSKFASETLNQKFDDYSVEYFSESGELFIQINLELCGFSQQLISEQLKVSYQSEKRRLVIKGDGIRINNQNQEGFKILNLVEIQNKDRDIKQLMAAQNYPIQKQEIIENNIINIEPKFDSLFGYQIDVILKKEEELGDLIKECQKGLNYDSQKIQNYIQTTKLIDFSGRGVVQIKVKLEFCEHSSHTI